MPLRRNRDFILLWSGLAVSVVGTRLSALGYPLLVLALTQSPKDAGLVAFLATLPYIVFQLPAGALVDRVNRKRLMIAADAGRLLALVSLVAAYELSALTLAQIMVVAFVEGTFFVVFNLAEQGAVRFVVPPEQLSAALAQNEARNRGSAIIGQPLGGVLFSVGRIVPFFADALSYVVSLATLLAIRSPLGELKPRAEEKREPLREVREGIAWLYRHPFLRTTALLVAGSNFIFRGFLLVLIVVAKNRGASSTTIGLMLAGAGIGGLLGALSASFLRARIPAKLVVVGVNWLWAVLLVPVVFATSPVALGVLYGAMVFLGPVWNVVLGTYQLSLVPERLLARVSSVGNLLAFGALPVGSLTAGLLLSSFGSRDTIVVFAFAMFTIAALSTVSPSVRGGPTLAEAQAQLAAATGS